MTKLPASAHTAHPWRIHEVAADFQLEDVWALPTPGGPHDLSLLVDQFVELRFPERAPFPVRFLWAARWRLGAMLRLDEPGAGLSERVGSVRDRLPADLSAAPGPDLPDDHPFESVYQLPDEYAAELANKTVHGIVHLGWVSEGAGGYRGQMAVLVKPNGWLGAAYMTFIKPFRYALVYPALLRTIARDWQRGQTS